ncbi:MAG: AAA family ATPase [Planctomycetaceae bacterium]|nr:AAA family ATPase [Planctomycetaceae bacterium]
MKITSLEIERFGLWSGLTLPELSEGINVFYGANEAGKSTLLEFIRAILYGFGQSRRKYIRIPGKAQQSHGAKFLGHDFHAEHAPYTISGGILQMQSRNGDQYHIRRMYLPNRTGNEDQIDIQTSDGTKQGTQLLRSLVSGVDEQTFNNVFAIGLDELQRLASLNDTEAAEMLFRLSVGLDRFSIVETIKELSARRNKILNIAETEGKPSLLTQLLVQREKIIGELSDTKLLIRQYVQLRNEQRLLDRTVANLEEDHAKLQREKRLYEIARNAEPIWLRRDHVRDEVNAMGTVVVVADSVVQELNDVEQELTERRAAYDRVKDEYLKAKKAIASLPVNERVCKLAPRIEILLEEEPRIVELNNEIDALEAEINEYNKRITNEESQIRRGRYPLPPNHGSRPANRTGGNEVERPDQLAEPSDHSAALPRVQTTGQLSYNESGANTVQASVLEEYRTYAKSVNKARKRYAKAQGLYAEFQRRFKDLNDRLKVELAKRDVANLSEAFDRATETVNQLRRRQSIGQKMNEMLQHHKELRRINTVLIQNQAVPGWILGMMALVVLGGVGCLIAGFMPAKVGIPQSLGIVIAILGSAMIVGPILAKRYAERNNAKKLDQNQQHLAALSGQIDRAKQEAAAIDARFPFAGTASLDARLLESQQELTALEKLMPVETQRQEVNQRLKQAEVRLQHSKEETTTATKRWDDWLRRVGLPSDWTPARIREYLEKCDVVGDMRKELDKRIDTVNQRIKDITMITNRIDNLVTEIGLTVSDGATYVEILGEIRKKLDENNAAVAKRDKLVKGIKEFRKMRRKVVADLQRATQQQIDLLRQFGVRTPEELRALHQRHQKHRRLLIQEQGIQRELEAAIGNFCSETTLAGLLGPRIARKVLEQKVETERQAAESDGVEFEDQSLSDELAKLERLPEIDDLLKDAMKRIETSSAKLSEELQNRGQLTEQLKRVAEDQTATQKQRELAIINEKIRQAQLEWQVYAVCARMLDEIRSTYERDRQPRTLAEASALLRRLTDDRYHRIWTPLSEETLLVDDRDGNTFDVAWLARGAREQLFIALRLALASEFARHGSVLPLILDDVLVNFDSRRAWSAIQVLQDVAAAGSGRQIFLFTCHEHVCRMFQKMDIPVRILPPVEQPDARMRVLQPRSVIERRRRIRLHRQKRLEADRTQQRIANEIAMREESIRLDAVRRAEVQRLIVQMQQQATAEKAVEAEQNMQRHNF